METTNTLQPAPISVLKGLMSRNYDKKVGCCAKCGKIDASGMTHMVETEQGFFPVGSTCAQKLIKAGYNVEVSE